MGNPKQKWTWEEESALKAGVRKHGAGKWKTIEKDPEFSHYLANRSNIDLKDKWRNMNVTAYGQGSREKTRTSKAMGPSDTQVTTSQNLAFSVTVKDDKKTAPPIDPARSSKDGKTSSRASSAKRKNQEQLATSVQWYIADTIEEATRTATYLIVDAEAKSFLVAEAVKKYEDVTERAQEMEVQLQLAMEIYERCASAELVVVELPGKDESKGRYEIYSSKMNND